MQQSFKRTSSVMGPGVLCRVAQLCAFVGVIPFLSGCGLKIQVATYHYDNLRTGWNQFESKLNYSNVANLVMLPPVQLDDQVDTQPLIVPDVQLSCGPNPGKHDVVYVTTENNTVYAIDALSGQILCYQRLGPPVPQSRLPGQCGNNGPNIGINGTPVIDSTTNTMYVIAFSFDAYDHPTYYIHALDLGSLQDKVTQRLVTASHKLSDGTSFGFEAGVQRQRAGLLLANGNVYAAFGSFCDMTLRGLQSRGWVLGWQAGTLTPLTGNYLDDTRASGGLFLSSVWMSGYGVASGENRRLYFATGNSDRGTYDGVTNIQESIVTLNPDLTKDPPPAPPYPDDTIFTPWNVDDLDHYDTDLGSGGVLLLPFNVGLPQPVAAAAGKDGRMFVLNRNSLGGHTNGDTGAIDIVNIGPCWCGPSYFNDGTPHIVSSGGNQAIIWGFQVQTPPNFKLVNQASSPAISTGQDSGFFTSVSSLGNTNAIIWAVSRPTNSSNPTVSLFAFKATPSSGSTTLTTLFPPANNPAAGIAGSWPNTGGNANIVPVVANGKVYVASFKQLAIFGLPSMFGPMKKKGARPLLFGPSDRVETKLAPGEHDIYGTVSSVEGQRMTLQTRMGKSINVDARAAIQAGLYIPPVASQAVEVRGTYGSDGTLNAQTVLRAKTLSALWPPDR
jgi:hypothetical protein